MINGIINVYKEAGFTSFDVVAKLRGITHQKKIGHTGTLDPDAVGVLPVCFGNATKVCALLTDWDKTYETVLRLGLVTDTQDTSGQAVSESAVSATEDEIKDAVFSFVGDYDQLPPMFSAKKINGQHLYDLARKGIEVERKTCRVHINEIEILDMWWEGDTPCDPPSGHAVNRVRMSVNCSKGTYIRTLCNDIGEKLGCGGCMEYLKRTSVGPFTIDKALKLNEIEEICQREGCAESVADSVDSVFMEYPAVRVNEENEKYLMNGNELMISEIDFLGEKIESDRYRVYDHKGVFTALYGYDAEREILKPVKMFLQ